MKYEVVRKLCIFVLVAIIIGSLTLLVYDIYDYGIYDIYDYGKQKETLKLDSVQSVTEENLIYERFSFCRDVIGGIPKIVATGTHGFSNTFCLKDGGQKYTDIPEIFGEEFYFFRTLEEERTENGVVRRVFEVYSKSINITSNEI